MAPAQIARSDAEDVADHRGAIVTELERAARDAADHARRHTTLCRKVPARGQVSFPERRRRRARRVSPKSAISAGSSLSSATSRDSRRRRAPLAGEAGFGEGGRQAAVAHVVRRGEQALAGESHQQLR